ncbi:MAG: beta-N-acetylhexosaminidase [Prevotella sp.]|nr:beta-N-acetylhexosaminidase [Prevotella sp.]
MKKILILLLACLPPVAGWSMEPTAYDVVPKPQHVTMQKGNAFVMDSTVAIVCETSDEAMQRNACFLLEYIQEELGIDVEVTDKKVKRSNSIRLTLDTKLPAEGYRLTVTTRTITIAGGTAAGVFYGIQTLRKSMQMELMPAVIEDEPRFAYRGMHLDCARHFFSVREVKQYIDMMALHNMNRFHWHLTDDQGWRIEIKKYPRLTEVGSLRTGTVIGLNSDVDDGTAYGGFYSQDEIRDIVRYAQQRYITIVPEIDMPGHMVAALASYPELGCTGGPYEVGHKWGVSWDVLCVGNPKSLEFAKDVLREVASLFPSTYIHIGGDETPTDRWEHCNKCKGLKVKNIQGHFTHEIELFLKTLNRKVIGWDEVLEMGADTSTVIMSWRGSDPGFKAAAMGHDVIMTPTTHCYWDYCQTTDTRFEPSQVGKGITVEKVYSLDPAPDSIAPAARRHIIGVQANLWTEYVRIFRHAQYQVLPRMAALAEVQWTTPAGKDYNAFLQRLERLVTLYDRQGWQYALHLWPQRQPERWHF